MPAHFKCYYTTLKGHCSFRLCLSWLSYQSILSHVDLLCFCIFFCGCWLGVASGTKDFARASELRRRERLAKDFLFVSEVWGLAGNTPRYLKNSSRLHVWERIYMCCWLVSFLDGKWKKSCTTWDVWNPVNNRMNYQPQPISWASSINNTMETRWLNVFFFETSIWHFHYSNLGCSSQRFVDVFQKRFHMMFNGLSLNEFLWSVNWCWNAWWKEMRTFCLSIF